MVHKPENLQLFRFSFFALVQLCMFTYSLQVPCGPQWNLLSVLCKKSVSWYEWMGCIWSAVGAEEGGLEHQEHLRGTL